MAVVVMIAAIPAAGLLCARLMRGSYSWKRGLVVSGAIALALSASLPFWFGWDIGASDVDPVAGLILYLLIPAIALASVLGTGYAMERAARDAGLDRTVRWTTGLVAWGVALTVSCLAAMIGAASAGMQAAS